MALGARDLYVYSVLLVSVHMINNDDYEPNHPSHHTASSKYSIARNIRRAAKCVGPTYTLLAVLESLSVVANFLPRLGELSLNTVNDALPEPGTEQCIYKPTVVYF